MHVQATKLKRGIYITIVNDITNFCFRLLQEPYTVAPARTKTKFLMSLIIDIQEVAAMALKDQETFYGRLSRRMEKQYLADTDSLKKSMRILQSAISR